MTGTPIVPRKRPNPNENASVKRSRWNEEQSSFNTHQLLGGPSSTPQSRRRRGASVPMTPRRREKLKVGVYDVQGTPKTPTMQAGQSSSSTAASQSSATDPLPAVFANAPPSSAFDFSFVGEETGIPESVTEHQCGSKPTTASQGISTGAKKVNNTVVSGFG